MTATTDCTCDDLTDVQVACNDHYDDCSKSCYRGETMDESLYEDDLDHEGHWFEIWGED